MAKKKNADSGQQKPPDPVDEKFSEGVKFRPTFKRKLERVAQKAGLYPGELVERHMHQFVEAEYLVILREELRLAEEAAKRG